MLNVNLLYNKTRLFYNEMLTVMISISCVKMYAYIHILFKEYNDNVSLI